MLCKVTHKINVQLSTCVALSAKRQTSGLDVTGSRSPAATRRSTYVLLVNT